MMPETLLSSFGFQNKTKALNTNRRPAKKIESQTRRSDLTKYLKTSIS